MAGIIIGKRLVSQKSLVPLFRRFVSTSKKNNDTITAEATTATTTKTEHKSWMSYGFEQYSKTDDRNALHSISFVAITVCMVGVGFYLAYVPDYGLRDWATREGFLELRRREKAGLLPIDPNFIDPATIELPSDEELGDTEIII